MEKPDRFQVEWAQKYLPVNAGYERGEKAFMAHLKCLCRGNFQEHARLMESEDNDELIVDTYLLCQEFDRIEGVLSDLSKEGVNQLPAEQYLIFKNEMLAVEQTEVMPDEKLEWIKGFLIPQVEDDRAISAYQAFESCACRGNRILHDQELSAVKEEIMYDSFRICEDFSLVEEEDVDTMTKEEYLEFKKNLIPAWMEMNMCM